MTAQPQWSPVDDATAEWAASLKEAKAEHGWTRELYTSIRVRRAQVEDLGGDR